MNILPTNSIVISQVTNGFRVSVNGTMEQQEDNLSGEYVFESIESLQIWMNLYFIKYSSSDPKQSAVG